MIDWNSIAAIATAIAAIATALGVGIAAWQIRESRKLAQTSFEDSIDQQYRELAKGIPVDALIGNEVSEEQKTETRELIYNYLDLCNEQTYLRFKNRVSGDTWNDWTAGIQAHLEKTEFRNVWNEIKSEAPGTFTLLEKLEIEKFDSDPRRWN